GTLPPFCEDPKMARPYPWAPGVLRDIAASDRNRLIIVTGRTICELLELLPLPGVEIRGSLATAKRGNLGHSISHQRGR
ncbi:MAG: hypothetical protein ACUVQH_14795, partial [Thermogutta sp.]